MYQQKGSMGARIGAFLLDNIIINIIAGLIAWVSWELYLLTLPFLSFLYFGICEGSSMSASPGKRICGLIVVDESGMPLSYGTAFLRSLGRLISGVCLGIGFLLGLFDREGKTLHDRMARTFVASRREVYQQPAPPPPPPPQPQPQPQPQLQSASMKGNGNMNPQIIGISGQFAGRAFPIAPQGSMLGTDPASCDFVFPRGCPGISRNHCKIQYNPQTRMFILFDLGSSYGTFLGSGVRVPQGQPMALQPGDNFYLASPSSLFRVSL